MPTVTANLYRYCTSFIIACCTHAFPAASYVVLFFAFDIKDFAYLAPLCKNVYVVEFFASVYTEEDREFEAGRKCADSCKGAGGG